MIAAFDSFHARTHYFYFNLMFSCLFILKKNSCQHFDGGGDFRIFFDSLNFEEGRSSLGSPLFLFLILSPFSLTLSLTLNPSHTSLLYIFYLCQTNLIFYLVPKS